VQIDELAVASGHSTGLAVVLVADDGENMIAVSPGANHAIAMSDVEQLRASVREADPLLLQMELLPEVVTCPRC
jgi:ribokinase